MGLLTWEYVDLLERFSRVAPTLRPERTLTALCRTVGFPEEHSIYTDWGNRKQAVVTSLFHTLFGTEVKHVQTFLPPSPIREELSRWGEKGQQQEDASVLHTHLAHLFDAQIRFSLRARSRRQQWARKGK
jgi:hypothetical protein